MLPSPVCSCRVIDVSFLTIGNWQMTIFLNKAVHEASMNIPYKLNILQMNHEAFKLACNIFPMYKCEPFVV